jgi:hypothetical protein
MVPLLAPPCTRSARRGTSHLRLAFDGQFPIAHFPRCPYPRPKLPPLGDPDGAQGQACSRDGVGFQSAICRRAACVGDLRARSSTWKQAASLSSLQSSAWACDPCTQKAAASYTPPSAPVRLPSAQEAIPDVLMVSGSGSGLGSRRDWLGLGPAELDWPYRVSERPSGRESRARVRLLARLLKC